MTLVVNDALIWVYPCNGCWTELFIFSSIYYIHLHHLRRVRLSVLSRPGSCDYRHPAYCVFRHGSSTSVLHLFLVIITTTILLIAT